MTLSAREKGQPVQYFDWLSSEKGEECRQGFRLA